jgi:hypothetical protein
MNIAIALRHAKEGGMKITHPFFSSHEYIYFDAEGNLLDENDLILNEDSFWLYRRSVDWHYDWEFYDETK